MRRARLLALFVGVGVVATAASVAAAPPLMTRDDIICRAQSGVGFSYYWGGACWCASGCSPNFACSPGGCSGSCPSCTHSGTYGADCSGYVTKIWQVPDPIATTTCGHGPYVAATYTHSTSYWNVISRGNLERGDSLASSTHVLIYEQGDPWGSLVAYEARGCSYGIVRNWRTCSSSYVAARRINLGSSCACTPGQVESEGCGNCGTRSRTCQSDCHWGSWGACGSQGPCAPGAVEARDCCDCGAQSRSCSGQCTWGEWSTCDGPDPQGGELVCDTTELGPCAEGRVRCLDGCRSCVRIYEPIAEICDGVDNDCNGDEDDGHPTEMGETRPQYAAALVDSSLPAALGPNELATVWATFRNEGSVPWRASEIWLGTDHEDGLGSELYDPESWPAYDVAAVLDADVAPGGIARFTWTVRAPKEGSVTSSRMFRLMDPAGSWLRCPSPELDVRVRTTTMAAVGDEPTAEGAERDDGGEDAGCGCRMPASRGGPNGWLLLAGLGLSALIGHRRRARR